MLRSPLGEPVKNALRDAILSEIERRQFMNFSGVQYGQLSTAISATDFEIEYVLSPSANSLQGLAGLSGGTAEFIRITNISTTPKISFKLGGSERPIDVSGFQPYIFSLLSIVKLGSTVTVYLNRQEAGSITDSAWAGQMSIDTIGALGTPYQFFEGNIERIRMWVNGDRTTGTPVPGLGDIRIGDQTSIYQQDYSQEIGPDVWDTPTFLTNGWMDNGDDTYTHTGTTNGELRVYGVLEEGETYMCEITAEGGGGVIQLGGPPITGNSKSYNAGYNRVLIKAESLSTVDAIRILCSADAVTVSEITVKKWHGIELKNTVIPGDFDQFEKRAGDDFWLSENLLENASFDDASAWTLGAGWSISGGTASHDDSSAAGYLYQPGVVISGATYICECDVLDNEDGIRFFLGTTSNPIGDDWFYDLGEYAVEDISDGDRFYIRVLSTGSMATIDNISLQKKITYAPGAR
ncbi:MAG TPA: hypothetical protein DCZ12_13215 [Gammaproteobacteria bacterium]|nr:hypothetical protein [Gammaproteobacteria bacterium]